MNDTIREQKLAEGINGMYVTFDPRQEEAIVHECDGYPVARFTHIEGERDGMAAARLYLDAIEVHADIDGDACDPVARSLRTARLCGVSE